MKSLYKILGLEVIDFGLIWPWVNQMNPNLSVSIEVILIIPFVFVINLIIAAILFFVKRKEYSKLFLANSVISSIMMFYLFENGIDRQQNKISEQWTFQKADTTFSLVIWKTTNEFNMTYSFNPGSSWGFLDGYCEKENEKWVLKTDSLIMEIDNNKLIGFRNEKNTIKMKKIKK